MSHILIKNLYKSFGDNEVLKNINLEINDGELVTLLGPSGCGKSTLLRIIAGFTDINNGKVMIDGQDISNIPVNKRDVGMVFQSYALFPNMTVFENVAFGLKTRKIPADTIEEKVYEILSLVGLEDRMDYYPSELSGGQQQRVALSRALVTKPRVLLLDEPLSALDAKIRLSLRKLIKDVQRQLNITTIFVTHDQEEALSISDRVFIMNEGKIVQAGVPDDIYKKPESIFVAKFIGTFNFFKIEKIDADNKIISIPFKMKLDNIPKDINLDTMVGIRPEAIKILDKYEDYSQDNLYKGKIIDIAIMGNVKRITVDILGQKVLIDHLTQENIEHYKKYDDILLHIPAEACTWINE